MAAREPPGPGGGTGRLTVTVTYVQMHARPPAASLPPPPEAGCSVARAEHPTVSFYRYLYDAVGRRWLWYERREMSDDRLRSVICAHGVEIHVLYVGGVPAGYAELDRRSPCAVEIAYFGLVPEFIGRGLGRYFLAHALDRAWQPSSGSVPRRVWLHTCSLDHPRALPTYRRAGFEVYDRRTIVIDDPRRRLAFD